jgi:hypothetical protein
VVSVPPASRQVCGCALQVLREAPSASLGPRDPYFPHARRVPDYADLAGRDDAGDRRRQVGAFLIVSSRSRTHIAVVPAGLLARATPAVSSGTSTPRRGL